MAIICKCKKICSKHFNFLKFFDKNRAKIAKVANFFEFNDDKIERPAINAGVKFLQKFLWSNKKIIL